MEELVRSSDARSSGQKSSCRKVAAVIAVCASLLSACGSQAGGYGGTVTALVAYQTTVKAGSARLVETDTVTSANKSMDASSTASAIYSWTQNASQYSTDSRGAQGMRLHYDGRVVGSHSYGRMSLSGGIFATKPFTYPEGGKWFDMAWSGPQPSGITTLMSDAMGLLGQTTRTQTDPARLLGLLDANADSTQSMETVKIGGVDAIHTIARIPLRNMHLTKAEFADAERVLGGDYLYIEYWIDTDHRLRQLAFTLTLKHEPRDPTDPEPDSPDVAAAFPLTMRIQTTLSDFGVPAHIVAPPASAIGHRGTCRAGADGSFDCQF